MEIRALGRQSAAVLPKAAHFQTRPQRVWASLAPEQQETVFRTIITICRGLMTHAAQDKTGRGAAHDLS
jgi:hypothetical protein